MPNLCMVRQRSLTLKIPLTIAVAITVGGIWPPRSIAQNMTANNLDQRSDSDSSAGNRKQFAQRQPTIQVIKIRLNSLNDVSEWVRLERKGDQVKLLHTVVAPNSLAKAIGVISGIPSAFSNSDAARGVGLIGVLPPLAHTWYDHPTSRIVFVPDTCSQSSASDCSIIGTTTVTLPTGINLDQGRFTLEYTESKLVRTVTFRVPPQKL